MFDDVDSDCPECEGNAVFGDCSCDGGDLASCGVERYVEFSEPGRARVSRSSATSTSSTRRARREQSFRIPVRRAEEGASSFAS